MSHIILRVNTMQYLVGYNDDGSPKWQDYDIYEQPLIDFTDRSAADSECLRLQELGWPVIVDNERLVCEW